jgi:hypothetical protein
MTTTNQPQGVSEWDAVMKPLFASRHWPTLRSEAAKSIERDMIDMAGPDHGMGISGSDINHTIFGAARFVDAALRSNPDAFAHATLAFLEEL